jgi:hypothetical protein
MNRTFIGFSVGVAFSCLLLIIFLATGVWKRILYPNSDEQVRTRIITPREARSDSDSALNQQIAIDDNLTPKVLMEEGEIVIAILNRESEEGLAEEQFVVYHTASDAVGPVYLTCISFDTRSMDYRRMWNAPTAATRPETISIYSQDLVGDRNICIIVTGMNARYEHTMTIFRPRSLYSREIPFRKIAELQIDGSIVIQETTRSLAYQQGITSGQSFNIAAYGYDSSSDNILDQLETIYTFNPGNEQYERASVSRIPGSQIEQRRLREILGGSPGVFENFINDLWYYVSPQGNIDARQYLYFNPSGKEIIFFGDETQQVFTWMNSSPTRYGLYIRSQNISISTLLRFIDIELESLDTIKLRVFEDVRLKITVSTSWDGSYRRASSANPQTARMPIKPTINALYDSSWGRLQFNPTGEYILTSGATERKGRYVFFKADAYDLLELRPYEAGDLALNIGTSANTAANTENRRDNRMVYRVESTGSSLILSRVRLGTGTIQQLMEVPITLTPVEQ